MNPLQENIQTAVANISQYLKANQKATSWDLKIRFRLSSSVLYLALGQLLAEKKITLEADDINYHVTWGQKPAEAVAAPVEIKTEM